MTEIHMSETSSAVEGGCSGCTSHSGPGQNYRVWQVRLRNMTFRLCDACLAKLGTTIAPGIDRVRAKTK